MSPRWTYKCSKCDYECDIEAKRLEETFEKEDCPKCRGENTFIRQFPLTNWKPFKGSSKLSYRTSGIEGYDSKYTD